MSFMKNTLYTAIPKILLLCLLFSNCKVHAPAGDSANNKEALKWFKGESWKNGLKLDADKSTNAAEFARQYQANKAWWDEAFAFMKNQDLENLKPGRYPIDGDNVYATVTEAPDKDFEKTNWESHRKYNDIQYIIKGKEKIGVAALSTATVTKPYDPKSDVANYTSEGEYHTAAPGTFFIFFPQNLHRPSIKVEGYDIVKKLVVKVRTGI